MRVYQYNEVLNKWDLLDSDIDGEDTGDDSGQSVALSADGLTVAIGANSDDNGFASGHTRIFRFNQAPHYIVRENTTSVTDVISSDDLDMERDGLVYSISDNDAEFFAIDSDTGVISFIEAPDFETPLDIDEDNDYQFTVSVTDSDNLTTSQTILVTVASENEAPSVSPLKDVSLAVNSNEIVEFLLLDEEGDDLTVLATSSNQTLISNSSLVITNSEGRSFLEVKPIKEQVGTATITLNVSDGVNEVTESFVVTVVNLPPRVFGLIDMDIAVNDSGVSNFFVTDDGGPEVALTVSATSSNQDLVPNSALTLIPSGTSYSLVIDPSENQIGTTIITITVSDGVNEVTESFEVIVGNESPRLIFTGQSYNGLWEQLGLNINGEAFGDNSGHSISVSSDGLTVAIGAPRNDVNGSQSGHTRIYCFNEGTAQWEQLGSDIDGAITNDLSGWSVSLSADGLRVAIGAFSSNGVNGFDSGRTVSYTHLTLPTTPYV